MAIYSCRHHTLHSPYLNVLVSMTPPSTSSRATGLVVLRSPQLQQLKVWRGAVSSGLQSHGWYGIAIDQGLN